ncbi:proton-coupled amino acid transporter-like protein pathetic isoform X2 [Toxorhynchites rutilus septentrionalis]|uniref:proton-coupled amino acid transporter-like protein pathetic isoform X2 n=1 Tax=Toxorhynchites rutilus septentrionalis TaxID=329112 RepID=UPI00247A5BB4|nr:proton-coupled amino acid transporter-like protein pathetic isoform X2 [Toxorhynchites rutilus septentrionalis]
MASEHRFNNNNSEKCDTRYKITPAKTDVETASGSFDPFKERNCEHPTTDGETLTHLLKASLGTGILAMPIAFSYAGLVGGILATVLTALICTHCAYVLVKCAHTLYHRTKSTAMTFAEVAEVALDNGPQWGRGWGKFVSKCITYGLFVTYFGTCAVYTVIIATNFQQVIEHYTGTEMNLRMTIALLLVPLILLSWIPNLKYLAPVSMIANVFMCVGLGITFYYLVTDMPPLTERPLFISVLNWPSFFAIVIFAMEAIGVVMPLENQMKTPQNFIGICGVLNQGMAGVTLIYIFLGFLGYVRYGDQALGSITLNLPVEEIPAQAVKILIALAVYCTFGLQFYVCLDIVWIGIRNKFRKRPTLVNYTMRTVLVTAAVLLAVAVPTIGPFIGLIGAFCFSILGLLIPILIEMVTYWDQGFGKFNWIIWKNVLVSIFGIIALVFGSKTSIEDIIKLYTN